MNSIIQKCLKELENKEPKLDYIKGLLEAAVMMTPQYTTTSSYIPQPTFIAPKVDELIDEEKEIIDRYEKGSIGKIT